MREQSPSRTAAYMALFRALESAKPPDQRPFDDPFAAAFLEPRLRIAATAARIGVAGRLIERFIDHRWPGPRPSAVVRTRAIDDMVSDALGSGCRQLLLLGAGYDTRPYRLPAPPTVEIFEVDHPATQALKRATLQRCAPDRSAAVHWVPLDFERDSLFDALDSAGFRMGARTCVLWEGVFSYLTLDAIEVTLRSIRRTCGPGSRVMLTYVDESALQPTNHPPPWVSAVSDAGEPFITGLDPARASDFFAKRGLRVITDESTWDSAWRLAPTSAATIPGFYRIALLEPMTPAAAVEPA